MKRQKNIFVMLWCVQLNIVYYVVLNVFFWGGSSKVWQNRLKWWDLMDDTLQNHMDQLLLWVVSSWPNNGLVIVLTDHISPRDNRYIVITDHMSPRNKQRKCTCVYSYNRSHVPRNKQRKCTCLSRLLMVEGFQYLQPLPKILLTLIMLY